MRFLLVSSNFTISFWAPDFNVLDVDVAVTPTIGADDEPGRVVKKSI